jgi:TPP-dependent trihydroxycyclohexane-1,2-dione (THcHDO) dehydratase
VTSQAALDFEPEPVRVPAPDNRIAREERPRLKRQAIAVLERLQAGRASNLELVDAGGGVRYSARIAELRAVGYDVQIVERDHATGRVVYELVR